MNGIAGVSRYRDGTLMVLLGKRRKVARDLEEAGRLREDFSRRRMSSYR